MNINQHLKDNPRPCKYGAPMGAADWCVSADPKFYLQRLKFTDGCYSLDGTYWGSPANVWCAWDPHCEEGPARMFVRANTREKARDLVLQEYPNAKFFR